MPAENVTIRTREAAWIAGHGGRRVGCVFCVAADEQTAQLRILLVDPPRGGTAQAPAWSTSACSSPARPAASG